ncbi:MAG: NUDIX domain-containing protein [Clostridia bacterium]
MRRKKEKPQEIQLRIAILRNEKGEVLMTRRPDTGLLAGLWEFPESKPARRRNSSKRWGKPMVYRSVPPGISSMQGMYSPHQVWQMQAYEARAGEACSDP